MGEYRFNHLLALVTIEICKKFLIAFLMCFILKLVLKSHEKIKDNDVLFLNKYSTLFYEFKSDSKIALSYYSVFILRRIIYAFTQIFLSSYPIIQMSVNAFFSLLNVCFLIMTKPFSDTKVLISNIIGEICYLGILITVFSLTLDTLVLKFAIETAIILTLNSFITFQMIMVFVSVAITIRIIIERIKKSQETRVSYIIK